MSTWSPSYTKLGPPKHTKPRPYHPTLEHLETQSNKNCIKDYEQEIHNYLSLIETNSVINCSMIDLQPEIQWYMRPYLLDFLIEIHQSFRLHPQTLFLAVNIIDKYCSKRVVFKRHYQLVGCTALWLAAKYEDKKSRVPTLKELTIMCRNAYDQEMFVQMEKHILSTLEWSLTHTSLEDCLQISLSNSSYFFNETPLKFQGRNQSKESVLTTVEQITRFFCELSLYERNYLKFSSSLIAISAHLLSCRILGSETAVDSMEYAITQHYSQNRDIDDDETFDENLENEVPNVVTPFLSGFDDITIDQIIIIAILFINSFKDCSHALKNKYKSALDSFDTIQAIDEFINKYSNLINIIPDPTTFEDIQDLSNTQEFNYAGSYLLGLTFQQPLQPPSVPTDVSQQLFIPPPTFQSHLNTPQSASSTITSIFSSDLQNYSTSSLLTPTASSPMDPKFQFKDPDMGTFVNKRYEGDAGSPLAQRSMNKMNMMV